MAMNPMSEFIQHLRTTMLVRDGAELTDEQLLEDYIGRHDEAALAALVRRHGPMVWGVCRRVLPNYHDAEDAFQATFLVFVRKAASITSRELLANWLYGVAHQTARKARATAAKRCARERQVKEMPEPAVTEQDLWRDLQPLLDEELSLLPARYRAVIVLCDLEGKTRKEAARQLGVPEGTVASRMATARRMLAKRLARHGLVLSGGALAAVVSQDVVSAVVPAPVLTSAIKAVTLVAAGQAAATGAISVKAAALTEGVLKTMLLTKLKTAAAVLMMMAVALAGVGVGRSLLYRTQAGEPETARQQAKQGRVPNLPAQTATTRQLDGPVAKAVWSPDGKWMATLSTRVEKEGKNAGFATLKIWDMQTGKLKHSFGETKLVNISNAWIGFSPDGKTAALCALVPIEARYFFVLTKEKSAQELQLWDVQKGERKRTIKMDYSGTWQTFAFSPDGKTVAISWGVAPSGRLASGARLFDTQTGDQKTALIGHESGIVIALAFSPDSKWLATGGDGNDQTVRLWDVQKREAIRTWKGVNDGSRCLAFSPDGKLLASGGQSGVRLWDVRTGEAKQSLTDARFTQVNAITFSPDGKLLATAVAGWTDGKATGEIKVWSAKTGELLRTESGTSFDSLAFTPDSQGLRVLLSDRQTMKTLRVKGEGSDKSGK